MKRKIKFTQNDVSLYLGKHAEIRQGITGEFLLTDTIHAYVTFTWEEVEKRGGRHHIKADWYSKDELISTIDEYFVFGVSPHYIISDEKAVALGLGKGKVNIFVDGQLMKTGNFEVISE